MSVMQKIFRDARLAKARVVLPELDDPRIKSAADRLIKDAVSYTHLTLPTRDDV